MIYVLTLIAAAAQDPSTIEKCRYLENLNRQYQGLTLTAEEQQIKREMQAWYRANCAPPKRK